MWQGLTLAAVAGLVHGCAYVWPVFSWSPLLAVGVLTAAACTWTPRAGFLAGFLYGLAFQIVALNWISAVVRLHGDQSAPVAAVVLILMAAVLAVFPAAYACAVGFVRARNGAVRALIAAPCFWVAFEFTQTNLPAIGFPWNLLGYSIAGNLAVVQIASWTGIHGLSFVAAAAGSAVAWTVLDAKRVRQPRLLLPLLVLMSLAGMVMAMGDDRVPKPAASRRAALVQTNLPQQPTYGRDWMLEHATEMDQLENLSVSAAGHSPDLIIWPEVPAPFYFLEQRFAQRAERIARNAGSHFLVGVVEWHPDPRDAARDASGPAPLRPYNSAVLLGPEGQREFVYDKIHLVAFGEYVPWRRWLTFAGKLLEMVSDFHAGDEFRVAAPRGGGKFGVFICFEAVFPNEVRQFTARGAELLINISNDGWFGRSSAPDQHLAMARVRAVENRRWLLRATNTGHTVAVDPYGRIVARLAPDRRGVLVVPYDFRRDLTLYARWGDWFAWLCAGLSAIFLGVARLIGEKQYGKSEIRN